MCNLYGSQEYCRAATKSRVSICVSDTGKYFRTYFEKILLMIYWDLAKTTTVTTRYIGKDLRKSI